MLEFDRPHHIVLPAIFCDTIGFIFTCSEPLDEVIRSCADGTDRPAWILFVRHFHRLIAKTIIQTARQFGTQPPEVVDDLIQETYLRILESRVLDRLRDAEPNAIRGLIQAVACSAVQDHFRAQRALKRGGGVPTIPMDDSTPSDRENRSAFVMERDVLLGEVRRILEERETRPRDRYIFWLYYRHGMSAKAISKIPSLGLTAKGVESTIQRLIVEVRRRLRPM